MKKLASSLLLALTLATPVVVPAVQAKPAASSLKVAQAKPKTKKSKAKKSAMKKEAGAMKKTEAPKSAAPAASPEPAKK
jgi:hypothetical protein